MTISITIIGHNEVDHLNELLPQLQWSDEVIYVDCESSDGSLGKAEELGCKTFSRPNDRNLNVNKSFAIDQASGDWIFYLDPDERIPSELVEEIREIVASETEYSAFRLKKKPLLREMAGAWKPVPGYSTQNVPQGQGKVCQPACPRKTPN